jgi:hypothetical protein
VAAPPSPDEPAVPLPAKIDNAPLAAVSLKTTCLALSAMKRLPEPSIAIPPTWRKPGLGVDALLMTVVIVPVVALISRTVFLNQASSRQSFVQIRIKAKSPTHSPSFVQAQHFRVAPEARAIRQQSQLLVC